MNVWTVADASVMFYDKLAQNCSGSERVSSESKTRPKKYIYLFVCVIYDTDCIVLIRNQKYLTYCVPKSLLGSYS